MFARFKIKAEDLRNYYMDIRNGFPGDVYSEDKSIVLNSAKERIMASSYGGVLDADQLKEGFFPTEFRQQFQVFISHSHKDIELVKSFANVLANRFRVRCFVDSLVWENMDDLLKEIDKVYCRAEDGIGYDYFKRNQSTAHTHAMLSIALLEMIEQCDCCIFIESENSTIHSLNLQGINNKDKTFSPWIYEEINYINHIEPRVPKRLLKLFSDNINERLSNSRENAVPIVHSINLDKFTEIDRLKLSYGSYSNDNWLEKLYQQLQ